LTIAYRLYQHQPGKENNEGLAMKIKPKQFQRTIGDKKSKTSFCEFLAELIYRKRYEGKTLLQYTQYCLEYDAENMEYGLPYLIVGNIADTAPEVMFVILYRIMIKGDRYSFNTSLHRKLLGLVTLFIWLGKGEKQRDHLKLLYNIWPCVSMLDINSFCSGVTIQRALLNNVMTPFPTYDKKHDRKSLRVILKYQPTPTLNVIRQFNKDTRYGDFVTKIFYNKELLLYAQRQFLSKMFSKGSLDLEDTNLPFDWDHISPNKYIHRKFGIPQIIKDWYTSIGNFRAWPYSLNRMDQDLPPARKLNPVDPENYHESESEEFARFEKKWQNYISNNRELISSKEELSKCLLDWSFCNEDWRKCWASEMKKDKHWKEAYNLIMKRNLSIAECWYRELQIEELLDFTTEAPTTFFNNWKWELLTSKYNDKEIKVDLIVDDFYTWISKPIVIEEEMVYMVYRYLKNEDSIFWIYHHPHLTIHIC
jgi:hypothetical protein